MACQAQVPALCFPFHLLDNVHPARQQVVDQVCRSLPSSGALGSSFQLLASICILLTALGIWGLSKRMGDHSVCLSLTFKQINKYEKKTTQKSPSSRFQRQEYIFYAFWGVCIRCPRWILSNPDHQGIRLLWCSSVQHGHHAYVPTTRRRKSQQEIDSILTLTLRWSCPWQLYLYFIGQNLATCPTGHKSSWKM